MDFDLGLGLGSKLKINISSIRKNFLQTRVTYIDIMVISYIYVCNANQTVQNRSKIKETKTEDGDNESLCTLNNNIVMIAFEKSLHNIKAWLQNSIRPCFVGIFFFIFFENVRSNYMMH